MQLMTLVEYICRKLKKISFIYPFFNRWEPGLIIYIINSLSSYNFFLSTSQSEFKNESNLSFLELTSFML